MLNILNREVSLKKKIYSAFYIAGFGIVTTGLFAIYSLIQLNSNYEKIEKLNSHVSSIIQLNDLVSELKRNVTIYTYTGHQSIQKSVRELISEVEASLTSIQNDSAPDTDPELLEYLKEHLDSYSEAFQMAVIELRLRKKFTDIEIQQSLTDLKSKRIYRADVSEIESLILTYFNSPSGSLSAKVFKKIDELSLVARGKQEKAVLKTLRDNFLRASQAIRNYLYLVNVVMAGEALEFEYVSSKIKNRSLELSLKAKKRSKEKNKKIIFLFTLILVLLTPLIFYLSFLVASGISHPLMEITDTLNRITQGETNVKIPLQDRSDEIGILSRAAETYRERTNSLENSNEELSQFAYRTSHDLKAPLMSILGITSIMEEDLKEGDCEEVSKNIQKVRTSAGRLEVLIGDILDLSRAENVDQGFVECDLFELVQQIEEKMQNLIAEADVNLIFESLKEKKIVAQRVRIQQVLENLISNAIKYSDPEKSERFISLSLSEVQGGKRLMVEDNGLGIPTQYQKDLFRMFKRFHTKVSFGSGLGLYLVKKHIEKMNAIIRVDSKEGRGSTFSIDFPSTETQENRSLG